VTHNFLKFQQTVYLYLIIVKCFWFCASPHQNMHLLHRVYKIIT